MKIYKISIKFDSDYTGAQGVLQSILNEAEDDHRQLSITKRINAETLKAHKWIAEELSREIDTLLGEYGVKTSIIIPSGNSNGYQISNFTFELNRSTVSISVGSFMSDRKFTESKYCTHTGSYEIRVTKGDYRSNKESSSNVKNLKGVVEYLKNDLKLHIDSHKKYN